MNHGDAIAARLAEMRKSQRWLAIKGGWSPNAVQKWIKKDGGITKDNLATLEKILGTKLARVRRPVFIAKDPPTKGRQGMGVSEILAILLSRLPKPEQEAILNDIVNRIETRARQDLEQVNEEDPGDGDGESKDPGRSFGSAS